MMSNDDDPIADDEALDYIVYKEVTGDEGRGTGGCLSMIVLLLLPVGCLVGWTVASLVN